MIDHLYVRAPMRVWTPQELRVFLKHMREDRLYAAWLLLDLA